MTKVVKTRLKELLDERGLSIRNFAFSNNLRFETVRKLYNNTARQYQEETLGKICEALNIDIKDLLILVDVEKTNSEDKSEQS
ncbi:helix-turn-helix domain-containing protein [Bacillus mojavensis]|uniref:helix-turn-helix domain-containing protein n=1 Tax=Bacillus mojavensis TaxID=72360 RepID=UPI002DBFF3F5|nr:helix-turn-helix transcriptional regulator [Bacillus mojavensis]MEC1626007.1 helix-turn-helix transcriptional regulator [Bacillus mojavensis]MEC1670573.1 helix-turn-helix transcriptional regulator [Bacillus mojavensis]